MPDAPPDERPAPAPPVLPRSTGFARELAPTWLAAAALLAGHRPPDTTRLERYVHLGCGTGETAAVVAAAHPTIEVWAWDPRPEHLEATRRLAQAAGLANLVVHEARDLPVEGGPGPADIVVVQDVLTSADDEQRARIGALVRASVRPGGLLCVTYPTLAAWSEIAPVAALLHRLARTHHGAADDLVPAVLDVVRRLRDGGAKYLTQRPVVASWLDQLVTQDPGEITARFLRDPFRPLSPAQVAQAFAPAGCELLGSARLLDDLDVHLPPALAKAVAGAPNRVLRETYSDLATKRPHRIDLFRLGGAPLDERERGERIASLNLAGLAAPTDAPAIAVDRDAWRHLTSYGVVAGTLHEDADHLPHVVRVLLDAGQAHPVVSNGPGRGALEACEALNAALSSGSSSASPADVWAVALLGTAVPTASAAQMRAMPPGRGAG